MAKAHKRQFCGECGQRMPADPNDLEPSVKAAAPVLAKSAAGPLAAVPSGQQAASAHWMREMYGSDDPGQRVNLWNMAHRGTGNQGRAA